MEDIKIIGRNIKSYRESYGLNQEQIANLLEVSRGTVNYYENGARMPSMNMIQKLSDLFGIEPIDLLNEDNFELELNSKIAFKKKKLTIRDLNSIARFRRIARNYIKLVENY